MCDDYTGLTINAVAEVTPAMVEVATMVAPSAPVIVVERGAMEAKGPFLLPDAVSA
jgi:hypothetical protein